MSRHHQGRDRFNPFITGWGYALSTLALGCGLALGWFFHQRGEQGEAGGWVAGEPGGNAQVTQPVEYLPKEAGAYRVDKRAVAPAHAVAEGRVPGSRKRDSAVYASRRAYPGAPPRVPHALDDGLPGFNCLSCHEQGGYAERFNAYAPKTPHPEWTQCRQCHVPTVATTLFAANHFQPRERPQTQRAYPGAPPPIPHDLQYRENCSACHSGPGAMQEIRTSHPERIGCTQCHVPRNSTGTFIRELAGMRP